MIKDEHSRQATYNEIMRPKIFYGEGMNVYNTSGDTFSIPNPLASDSRYRAVYMDGNYVFATPQSVGDVACIERCAKSCRDLEGDIAEAGVYFGATARLILRFFDRANKTIHLFDTFDVMPDANPDYDIPERWHPQKGLSVEFTKCVLRDYYDNGQVVFHKGLFKDTLHEAADKKFCFVHIDCDLYDGAKDAVEFFYPRMVTGGVMMFHDYDTKSFPGIKKAVESFFIFKTDLRMTNRYGSHHVVVKR
jgi:O-methyltransferase